MNVLVNLQYINNPNPTPKKEVISANVENNYRTCDHCSSDGEGFT